MFEFCILITLVCETRQNKQHDAEAIFIISNHTGVKPIIHQSELKTYIRQILNGME